MVDRGTDLWDAFAAVGGGTDVRFVCPTYEIERGEFAARVGLTITESWWLRELDGPAGGEIGARVVLPGAEAFTVSAPPVHAPPGPVLFLPAPEDVTTAVPAALAEAPARGCAAVVVNHVAGRTDEAALAGAGFRRHCDFYGGIV